MRVISSSELRSAIGRVLSEVGYGRAQYVIEKFGQPTAAIVSIEDFRLLQTVRREQAAASLLEVLARIRQRARNIDPEELDTLVEEARAEFHRRQGC